MSKESGLKKLSQTLTRVRHFVLDDVWEVDLTGWPRWRRAPILLIRLVSVAIRGFIENKCRLRAAALTYATVFSLIPILALGFAMAGAFKGPIQEKIEDLKTYAIRTLAPEDTGVFEDAVKKVNEFIENFNNRSIGAIGAILLIFSTVSLLTHIESALNETWGVRYKRAFLMRVLNYWGLVTLGTIILAASLSLTARSAEIGIVHQALQIGAVQRFVEFITPYSITSVFLCLVYKFMPNTQVRFRPALIGGIVGGVLWELSKNLYVFYVTEMLKGADVYVKVYSGMAAVPLFLLWLYLSWVIFLLGAEVAFAVQNTETYRLERKSKGISQKYRDLLALRVMLLVSRYFGSGKTGPDLEALAADTQAPVRVLNDVTYDLCQAGLLVQTAHPVSCYTPALPLGKVTAHTVLSKMRALGRTPIPADGALDLHLAQEMMDRLESAGAELFKEDDFEGLSEKLVRTSPADAASGSAVAQAQASAPEAG